MSSLFYTKSYGGGLSSKHILNGGSQGRDGSINRVFLELSFDTLAFFPNFRCLNINAYAESRLLNLDLNRALDGDCNELETSMYVLLSSRVWRSLEALLVTDGKPHGESHWICHKSMAFGQCYELIMCIGKRSACIYRVLD
jgi:hypothetical protein